MFIEKINEIITGDVTNFIVNIALAWSLYYIDSVPDDSNYDRTELLIFYMKGAQDETIEPDFRKTLQNGRNDYYGKIQQHHGSV